MCQRLPRVVFLRFLLPRCASGFLRFEKIFVCVEVGDEKGDDGGVGSFD